MGWRADRTTVTRSPSGSLSLPSTLIRLLTLSSSTVTVSSTASGGVLTGVTVIVTRPTSVPPAPSVTVYSKLAVPLKFVAGVNVIVAAHVQHHRAVDWVAHRRNG